jgi:hypothetical protein
MYPRSIVVVALAAHCVLSLAQTVYESKDKAGAVFSDRPSPGASAVQLQAPNVVDTPATTPAPAPTPASAPPAYRKLVVTRPAEQGTIHSNTGEFGVSANVTPPLRPGDRIRVLLDGNLVPTVFRSASLRISESDWQATAMGNGNQHTIQLAVVDAAGKPWIESAPVSFYVQRAAIGAQRR